NMINPNTQTIYVRGINNNTGCINSETSFDIRVNPIPNISSPANLQLCDDDSDGLISGFNLDNQITTILNGLNPADYSVSFHLTINDAILNNNPIVDTNNFQNTTQNQQTIYVRVTNNTTTCFNTVSFDLIVNPLPVNSPISDLVLCDTDTDGLVQNIDLSLQTQNIIDGQSPGDYSVSYYTSLNDAQNNTNPIVGPFTNTTPFSQTIYVRITNNTTGCFSTDSQFDIIINPEPQFLSLPDQEFCDDDTDGLVANIDLNALIPQIL
ncbi:hypothetical protein ACFSRZ_11805, partial [Pseudotenacibaculum haliotis]